MVSPGIEPLFQPRSPIGRPARLLAAKSVCCIHPKTGTPDRIRTGTEQCLRLLPATNWATGALFGSSYWDRTSDLHRVRMVFYL